MKKNKCSKILFLMPSLVGGGAERVVLNLLNALASHDVSVDVLLFANKRSTSTLLDSRVGLYQLQTNSLRSSLISLVLFVRRIKPSVVFSTLGYINVAVTVLQVLFPRNTRIWLREANLPSISLPNNRFPRLMRWAYILRYPKSDFLICSSERMRAEFIREFGMPSNKLRTLPNPVDEKVIRIRASESPLVHAPPKCFVSAGRLTHQKGFDRLLRMFASISDIESELVILGEGAEEGSLRKLAQALQISPRVRFVGFTDNPWKWFAVADAFLLSSRWEGMPNAALEALACGLPVIATPESGGIAEVAAASSPGAVQVVEAGQPFLEAMKKVKRRSNDVLPTSLLPPQYRLDSVVDTFVTWMDEVV